MISFAFFKKKYKNFKKIYEKLLTFILQYDKIKMMKGGDDSRNQRRLKKMKYYVLTRNEQGDKISEKVFKDLIKAHDYLIKLWMYEHEENIELVTRDENGYILNTISQIKNGIRC